MSLDLTCGRYERGVVWTATLYSSNVWWYFCIICVENACCPVPLTQFLCGMNPMHVEIRKWYVKNALKMNS